MKNMIFAVALLFGLAMSVSAEAGEPNLKALGLGGMKKMSQPAAKEVRGQGAIAWGASFAVVPGTAASTNGYFSTGRFVAGGINGSVAFSGFFGEVFRPRAVVAAGGFSGAFGF